METTTRNVAMESYKLMNQQFAQSPEMVSVVSLIKQIRAGFCPGSGVTLNAFALLCEDYAGQETLLKSDEEGWHFWVGWRKSYEKDLATCLIPMWQQMLLDTGIYQTYVGDIRHENDEAFGLRLHGVEIVLTTMPVDDLLSEGKKRIAAWDVYEIVDDSDPSVGMYGECQQDTAIPKTIYVGQAMVEATALAVKQLLDSYSRNRAEAETEAELREQEIGAEQIMAEAQGASL